MTARGVWLRLTALVATMLAGAALLPAALASSQTSSGAQVTNWLTWGGPGRDFIATDGRRPSSADKWIAEPPRKLWERPLGDGYSGIAVENGVLYTAYRRGGDDVVIALDAATGKTLFWTPPTPSGQHLFLRDGKVDHGDRPRHMTQSIAPFGHCVIWSFGHWIGFAWSSRPRGHRARRAGRGA